MNSITIDIDSNSTLALDLERVKTDLRIDGTQFDELLTSEYIPQAEAWAENTMRRSLIERTHRWIIDAFPSSPSTLYLPRGRVSAVASIAYSSLGSITTLTGPSSGSPAGTDYAEDLTGHVARVMPNRGDSWPSVDSDVPQPVKITYTAGYASAADIPGPIRRAMTAYVYGAMELDGLLQIRAGFDADFAEKLLSAYRLDLV